MCMCVGRKWHPIPLVSFSGGGLARQQQKCSVFGIDDASLFLTRIVCSVNDLMQSFHHLPYIIIFMVFVRIAVSLLTVRALSNKIRICATPIFCPAHVYPSTTSPCCSTACSRCVALRPVYPRGGFCLIHGERVVHVV